MSPSMPGRCMRKALGWVLALGLTAQAAAAGDVEEQVLEGVNAARAQAGCPALVMNARLAAAARGHAEAMATKNFFGHFEKKGDKLSHRMKAQGYRFRLVAENIAAGQKSAAEVVRVWMGSESHRKNILNCRLRETGIALVYQADDAPIKGSPYPMRYYWVQDFGVR